MASTPKKPIRLCLNLNNRAHIGRNEFKMYWLPINNHFEQLLGQCHLNFSVIRVLHI